MSDLDVERGFDAMTALTRKLVALFDPDGADERRRLTDLVELLGRLVATATALPDGEASDPPDATGPTDLRTRVGAAFPSLGLYWVIFDGNDMSGSPEPVVGDAVGDLVEIIEDLYKGEVAGREAPEHAIWHWKLGFTAHWGRHAAHLQSVVTQVLVAG